MELCPAFAGLLFFGGNDEIANVDRKRKGNRMRRTINGKVYDTQKSELCYFSDISSSFSGQCVYMEMYKAILGDKSEEKREVTYETKINSIKAPVKVGDIVDVKVLDIDIKRNRINLTMII